MPNPSEEPPTEFYQKLKELPYVSPVAADYQQERRLQTITMLQQEIRDLHERIEGLQSGLRDKVNVIACLVHKLGGEVTITVEDAYSVPSDKILHEHRDSEERTITFRFTDPEAN